MRQAGRYMPEYRALREKVSFLELCKTPDLAAEVTVRAAERLGVDAAIIFADILLVAEPMGMEIEYSRDDGPLIRRPLREAADVDQLREADPRESLGFVFEAVRQARAGLNPAVTLIGFSGAPFTLASYLIEGGGSRHYLHTKRFMYRDPGAWRALMERLTEVVVGYLDGQIAAGAQVVQVFRTFVLPFMSELVGRITPGVPVIHFGTGTAGLLELMRAAGGDVIGLDWRVDLGEAWRRLGYGVAVQGNLDPVVLTGPREELLRQVDLVLRAADGRPGHIFNLGHGVLPETPVDNAVALVDAVHERTRR
jgi:uroporphyrinogen decarboxylase